MRKWLLILVVVTVALLLPYSIKAADATGNGPVASPPAGAHVR